MSDPQQGSRVPILRPTRMLAGFRGSHPSYSLWGVDPHTELLLYKVETLKRAPSDGVEEVNMITG